MNENSDYLQANSIHFDFFPAGVNKEAHYSDQLRIIATDRYLIGWIDRDNVAFTIPIIGVQRNTYKSWSVFTADERTIEVTKTQGCGCGSNLKSFHPFMGVPFAPRF